MSDLLWSFDQLSRFARYEDPEVRYWAADRLVLLYPNEAPNVIADLILDEHEATPGLVADHLGAHGSARHAPMLLRGFRDGTGLTPGRCLEALARLGYEAAPDIAETALHRRGLSEGCLAAMVTGLAGMASAGDHPKAADRAREFLLRRPELYAEPAALKGAVGLFAPADFGDLLLKWVTALHLRGAGQVDACVRVLLEELQLEDCGWCVHTDRSGRLDLERTFKAIESGFDLEIRSRFPAAARARIAEGMQSGQFSEISSSLGSYIARRAGEIQSADRDELPARLSAFGEAWTSPAMLQLAGGLEPASQQWLIGLLIAATIKVTQYRNYLLELERAEGDLDMLFALADVESSCLLRHLPERLARAAGEPGGHAARSRLVDWCARTLEARGPFFPKALALDTLGLLEAVDLIPEIAAHLEDENPYIYSAAERSLARLGEPVVDHARAIVEKGSVHPETVLSLVRLACEMSRESSLAMMLEQFDQICEIVGPDAAAEAAGVLARAELMPHLRRWLPRDTAMVGHAMLLVGAVNNLPIPEEESILKAIDDYWKGSVEEAEERQDPESATGRYLM